MKIKILSLVKVLLVAVVFVWYAIFLAKKIDLTTADLGRHIINGQILVHGSWSEKTALLNTNYFSYTMPDQPFVNHHWLSGVLFFAIYSVFGFTGLSVFYILFGVLTLGLFHKLASEKAGIFFTSFVVIALMPLLASRNEVRPEIITYFLTAIFFYILYRHNSGQFKRAIWFLPVLSLLWINLHIGFVFGFLVLVAFFLETFFKWIILKRVEEKEKTLRIFFVGWGCVITSLLNPHFYKGLIYPLNIFKNYGYLIVENQSIKFLENLNFTGGQNFFLFKLALALTLVSFVLAAIFAKRFSLANFIIILVTAFLAYTGIRHFPSFAFFVLLFIAVNFAETYKSVKKTGQIFTWKEAILVPSLLFLVLVSIYNGLSNLREKRNLFGLGLMPQVNASADFFKKENLKGPVFSDYDIGGYLIFNFPKEKVFVDNRPEAYTVDFFENIYKPMQSDENKWHEELAKYNFNAIFFSHRDYTPWAQSFLIARVSDPEWAPVFADGYNIILLKRTEENRSIIKKFEIPKSRFGIR